jgi:hypothetical protein
LSAVGFLKVSQVGLKLYICNGKMTRGFVGNFTLPRD